MGKYVVTIARGFGSGGKEIGKKLADQMGISCYENRIVLMASELIGVNKSIFLEVDEKLRGSYISKSLRKMTTHTFPMPVSKKFVSDQELFDAQCEVIKNLVETESCVIIGKCSNKVLEGYDNVLKVYIEAPRKACVSSIMKKMEVDEKEANRLIERTDKYRADYYKYYTDGDYWTNPVSYDVTLNSGGIGRNECVDAIKALLRIKCGISEPLRLNV